MATFKYITGILGAPDNHRLAAKIFERCNTPIMAQAKGMSRYRLTDGSHIVCTYRAIWHTTRKNTSPLTLLGAKEVDSNGHPLQETPRSKVTEVTRFCPTLGVEVTEITVETQA